MYQHRPKRVCSIADKGTERSLDLATVARLHDIDLKPDRGPRCRHIPRQGIRCGKFWIDQQAHMRSSRNKLVQEAGLF